MKPRLVILAAGASERLGTCKALVEIGGSTVLARLLSAGAVLDDRQPLIVTGAHHAEIERAVAREPVHGRRGGAPSTAYNPDWARGRTSGIRLAHVLSPDCDLCLAPIDVPLVSGDTFARLCDAWERRSSPERGWLAPAVRSRRDAPAGVRSNTAAELAFGHPVVVGRALARELVLLAPDAPLTVLRARADPLWFLEVEDPSVLDDLDTPADLARLRAMFAP